MPFDDTEAPFRLRLAFAVAGLVADGHRAPLRGAAPSSHAWQHATQRSGGEHRSGVSAAGGSRRSRGQPRAPRPSPHAARRWRPCGLRRLRGQPPRQPLERLRHGPERVRAAAAVRVGGLGRGPVRPPEFVLRRRHAFEAEGEEVGLALPLRRPSRRGCGAVWPRPPPADAPRREGEEVGVQERERDPDFDHAGAQRGTAAAAARPPSTFPWAGPLRAAVLPRAMPERLSAALAARSHAAPIRKRLPNPQHQLPGGALPDHRPRRASLSPVHRIGRCCAPRAYAAMFTSTAPIPANSAHARSRGERVSMGAMEPVIMEALARG